MNQAILVVSFGTTFQDTMEKNIVPTERVLQEAFPQWRFARAFTSGMVMRRLRERGMEVDDVPTALQRLVDEGVTQVVIQPTHVMNGEEYDKLCRLAQPFAEVLDQMVIGRALLTTPEDFHQVVQAMCQHLPQPKPGQAIVLMGHGTNHPANAVYGTLEYVFRDLGRKDVTIGTVDGYPGFEEVCRRLDEMGDIRQVVCAPLMMVAGDHACNDLAGDEEDSWKSMLQQRGYQVQCQLMGLGEMPQIREIFVRHAREAAQKR